MRSFLRCLVLALPFACTLAAAASAPAKADLFFTDAAVVRPSSVRTRPLPLTPPPQDMPAREPALSRFDPALDLARFSFLNPPSGPAGKQRLLRLASPGAILSLTGETLHVESRSPALPIHSFPLSALFAALPGVRSFDAVDIAFDAQSGRWIVGVAAGPAICLALSEAGHSLGSWTVYRLAGYAARPLSATRLALLPASPFIALEVSWSSSSPAGSAHSYLFSPDDRIVVPSGTARSAGSRFAVPPQPGDIAPSSGGGAFASFGAFYNAPGDASSLHSAHLLINSTLSGAGACWVWYDGSTQRLGLVNDSGSSISFIDSGTVANSQCTLDRDASGISLNAGTLFLSLSLTFKAGFSGAKALYMNVGDSSGESGWQVRGSWLVPGGAVPPGPVSISPSSGLGLQKVFTAQFSSLYGAASITSAQILFNSSLNGANACWITYSAASPGRLFLVNDAGAGFAGQVSAGQSGSVANSQCAIDGLNSSVSLSGNTLTLAVSIAFQASTFGGPRTGFAEASSGSQSSQWQPMSDWIVPNNNPPPRPTSITPNGGGGQSQLFFAFYSYAGGGEQIAQASVLFNSSLSPANGCWIFFEKAQNLLGLANDAGTAVSYAQPGSQTVLSNSQCSLAAVDSGTISQPFDDTLTLFLSLTFSPSFGGAKAIYSQASAGGLTSGWVVAGSWIVPANLVAPGPLSVFPSSGAGTSANFNFTIGAVNGGASVTNAQVLINPSLQPAGGCWLWYNGNPAQLGLANDAGTAITFINLGGVESVQNSQCRLDAQGSSVRTSGADLQIDAALTFLAPFTGPKSVYGSAAVGSLPSGWQILGSWTPQ